MSLPVTVQVVPGTEKGPIFYEITHERDGRTWTVMQRFSTLDAMKHALLKTGLPQPDAPFPQKQAPLARLANKWQISWTAGMPVAMSADEMEERRSGLQAFLCSLSKVKESWQSDIVTKILCTEENEDLGIGSPDTDMLDDAKDSPIAPPPVTKAVSWVDQQIPAASLTAIGTVGATELEAQSKANGTSSPPPATALEAQLTSTPVPPADGTVVPASKDVTKSVAGLPASLSAKGEEQGQQEGDEQLGSNQSSSSGTVDMGAPIAKQNTAGVDIVNSDSELPVPGHPVAPNSTNGSADTGAQLTKDANAGITPPTQESRQSQGRLSFSRRLFEKKRMWPKKPRGTIIEERANLDGFTVAPESIPAQHEDAARTPLGSTAATAAHPPLHETSPAAAPAESDLSTLSTASRDLMEASASTSTTAVAGETRAPSIVSPEVTAGTTMDKETGQERINWTGAIGVSPSVGSAVQAVVNAATNQTPDSASTVAFPKGDGDAVGGSTHPSSPSREEEKKAEGQGTWERGREGAATKETRPLLGGKEPEEKKEAGQNLASSPPSIAPVATVKAAASTAVGTAVKKDGDIGNEHIESAGEHEEQRDRGVASVTSAPTLSSATEALNEARTTMTASNQRVDEYTGESTNCLATPPSTKSKSTTSLLARARKSLSGKKIVGDNPNSADTIASGVTRPASQVVEETASAAAIIAGLTPLEPITADNIETIGTPRSKSKMMSFRNKALGFTRRMSLGSGGRRGSLEEEESGPSSARSVGGNKPVTTHRRSFSGPLTTRGTGEEGFFSMPTQRVAADDVPGNAGNKWEWEPSPQGPGLLADGLVAATRDGRAYSPEIAEDAPLSASIQGAAAMAVPQTPGATLKN